MKARFAFSLLILALMLGFLTVNNSFASITFEQLSVYDLDQHYTTSGVYPDDFDDASEASADSKPDQWTIGALKRGAGNVPILKVEVTGEAGGTTLETLTVRYTGTRLADIGPYASMYEAIYHPNGDLKSAILLNESSIASGEITFRIPPSTIPAGETKTYVIVLDIASGAGSYDVDLRVKAVNGYPSTGFIGEGEIPDADDIGNIGTVTTPDPAGYAHIDATAPGLIVTAGVTPSYDLGTKILTLKFSDGGGIGTITNPRVNVIDKSDGDTVWRIDLSKIKIRAFDDSPSMGLGGASLMYPDESDFIPSFDADEGLADQSPGSQPVGLADEDYYGVVKIKLTAVQDAIIQNDILPEGIPEIYINSALTDYQFDNAIGEIKDKPLNIIGDVMPPMLVDEMPVKFNDQAKVLSLSFTETIDAVPASDVDLSKLKIKNATFGPIDITGANVTEGYVATVTITLTDAQKDILKGVWPQLDIEAGAVKDVAGNPISDVSDVDVYATPPRPVTDFAAYNPTDTTIDLTWTNSLYVFFAGTLVVRSQSPIIWLPTDGITYGVDEMVTPCGVVRYLGADDHSVTPFTDTELSPSTTYYYQAFAYDIFYNYSSGVGTSGKTLSTFPIGDVSGDRTVSVYDAALILQYVVGLINRFPVQDMISPSFSTPINYTVKVQEQSARVGDKIYVPVAINDTQGLVAGGISLRYDQTILRVIQVASLFNSAYWQANTDLTGEIRFAFASANPTERQRNLLMVEFEVLPNTEGKTSSLILDNVDLSNSLTITKINGSVTVLPSKSMLLQNYPNPFNLETWIPYQLASDSLITISIYDAKGGLIRTIAFGNKDAGVYTTKDRAAYWDGRDSLGQEVASGVYYYVLRTGNFTATRKMVILK